MTSYCDTAINDRPQPLILQGGQTACDGAASGYAYVIQSDHTLHHIPEGVVVVARQTSPRLKSTRSPLMAREANASISSYA